MPNERERASDTPESKESIALSAVTDPGPATKAPCPMCREKIERGAKICINCKSPLQTDETVDCPACKEPIARGATLCKYCKSDLTWRRLLPVGSMTMAMLTAFVAVLGAFAPQFKKLFELEDSKIDGVIISSVSDGITILANNNGTRIGAIKFVTISVPWTATVTDELFGQSVELFYWPKEEAEIFLKPKSTDHFPLHLLTETSNRSFDKFRLNAKNTPGWIYERAMVPWGPDKKDCKLSIEVVNSSGNKGSNETRIDCAVVRETLVQIARYSK